MLRLSVIVRVPLQSKVNKTRKCDAFVLQLPPTRVFTNRQVVLGPDGSPSPQIQEATLPKNMEATIDISAPPEQVWAVISDLKRMPEFSPQCVRMLALGAPKAGTWTLNLNRDGKKYWPTTARIMRYEPNQAFAFRINENRCIWSYTLEPTDTGTRLVERRDCPNGTTWFSRKAIDAALGGEQPFEEQLERGMKETLDRIKTAVEASA
jgi:uncharacterized protein YndB with AHSA1/START domain